MLLEAPIFAMRPSACIALLFLAIGCENRSGRQETGSASQVEINRIEVELEVFDNKGRARKVDLSLRDTVVTTLSETRNLKLGSLESTGDKTGGGQNSGRLRVHARLSEDVTNSELHGWINARLDRIDLVPLSWEVERRDQLSSNSKTRLDESRLEEHLKALVPEVIASLDRQVETARLVGDQLTEALAHTDPAIVVTAAQVLGQNKTIDATSALCRTLDRDEKKLQRAALDALSKTRDHKGISCIKTWAGTDASRLEEAIDAALTIGGAEAREYLEEVASRKSSTPAVIKNLAKVAVSKITGEFSLKRNDHDHDHSEDLENKRSKNPLITALTHSESQIRAAAAYELARLGQAEAVEPLCDLLDHDDPVTVEAALTALAELQNTKAVPCLTRWASTDDRKLTLVIEALAMIGGRDSRSVLEILQREHSSPVIRDLARDALTRLTERPR